MSKSEIILIVEDIRSAHNVGNLLRTADGLGIGEVYLCGITPYPEMKNDNRPPHIRQKIGRQIQKTALGAEGFVRWVYEPDVLALLPKLRDEGYFLAALEQTDEATELSDFLLSRKLALIIGNELSGVSSAVLGICDTSLKITMRGQKESFNVASAAAMALYYLSLDSLDKLKR